MSTLRNETTARGRNASDVNFVGAGGVGALVRMEQRDMLQTSKFDSVSSLLLAVLLIVVIFVSMLFVMWWDTRVTLPVQAIELHVENAAGRGDNAEGIARDFEPPGAEEVEAISEPTMQDTITAVTDAVSTVAASMTTIDSNSATSTEGKGGLGDSRPPGPESEGDDIVPRPLRWELNFSAKNLAIYAQQLDFYRIELAALGGAEIKGVDYASALSGTPKVRHGESAAEKRLYFLWTSESPLKKFDSQLLQKAGIPTTGRVMIKLLEPDIENMIADVELTYAKKNGHQLVAEIAKTVFASQAKGNAYEFVVTSQRYRKPKR